MQIATRKGKIGPFQPWVDVHPEALAVFDHGRRDWLGHRVKIGGIFMTVDRVEVVSLEVWRLHLIGDMEEAA